jgi:hypothetical protein
MTPIEIVGALVASGIALAAWSFLYRENAVYRIVEQLLIGSLAGYGVVLGLTAAWSKGVIPAAKGDLFMGLSVVVGILFFARFFGTRLAVYSRIPMALLLGVGFGVSILAMIQAQLVAQITDTMKSLLSIDTIIIFIAVVTTIFYFSYATEHKGPLAHVDRIGRIAMMVAFGTIFGQTFMGYVAKVQAAMDPIVKVPGIYVLPVAAAILAVALWKDMAARAKKK